VCDWGGRTYIDVTYRKVLAYVLVCNGPIIRSARERFFLFFIPASTLVSIEEMRSRVTLFRLKKANDWATAAALNNFLCDLLLLPRLISTGSKIDWVEHSSSMPGLSRDRRSAAHVTVSRGARSQDFFIFYLNFCIIIFLPTFTCDLVHFL
jgi:hypothetical protein